MLENLVSRGFDPKRPRLFIIDGSKGLRAAIRSLFGRRALVQRCQVHKMKNVLGHLPDEKHRDVRTAIREAYKCTKVETAKRLLNNLLRSLQKNHPSAAASLREGLDETLTVLGLGLSDSLARSLSTTNPIESLNDRIRTTARRVKRWDGGTMVLRWVLVGVLEAERGFRRLKGYKDMPTLVTRLIQHGDALVPSNVDTRRSAA